MVSSAPPPDLTSRIVRRERAIVSASVAALACIGWWFIATGAEMPRQMGMAVQPRLTALVLMWWLMMVAMMLPSAAPAILLYGRVRATRSGDPAIAGTWLFLAGYLAVWLLFSIAAALVQSRLADPSMTFRTSLARNALLIGAGIYQLSPLKSVCIGHCRSPSQFLSRHWRSGWSGAARLGLWHGTYCIGCCWVLMLLLFVGGVMNILWVVGLTVLVAIEKLAPRGEQFARLSGVVLIVSGAIGLAGHLNAP
jgi:predicted metal-binding membrane protein